MEIFIAFIIFLVLISSIWIFITGLILFTTGKDISISDILTIISSKKDFLRNKETYESILQNKFKYYKELPYDLKLKFLKRTSEFINSKQFILLPNSEPETEQKVLISATAIQVTFGLDYFLLEHFSKIFIYPNSYFSKFDNQYHKGEVNLQGAIVISLDDFFHGLDNEEDGINLGIHEMSHALSLELLLKGDYEEFFSSYFIKWKQAANNEFLSMKQRKVSFLREYAKTNMIEFFAVCVENFFERPKEFKATIPELYERLTILLNQDPADNNNLKISPRLKFSEKIDNSILSTNQLFKSKLSFRKITDPLMIWIVIILVLTYFTADFKISIFITLPFFIRYIFRIISLKTFYIYDDSLVIKSLLNINSEGSIFSFKKIIFISKDDYDDDIFGITFLSEGKNKVKKYKWFSGDDELKVFFGLLSQNKVIVRNPSL